MTAADEAFAQAQAWLDRHTKAGTLSNHRQWCDMEAAREADHAEALYWDAARIMPQPEFPAGTHEYEAYAAELRAALKRPGAWDFLDDLKL